MCKFENQIGALPLGFIYLARNCKERQMTYTTLQHSPEGQCEIYRKEHILAGVFLVHNERIFFPSHRTPSPHVATVSLKRPLNHVFFHKIFIDLK